MIEEPAYEISVFSHLIQIKRFKVLDLSRMPATGRARPNVRFGVIRDGRLAGHPHSTSAFARKPTFFSSQCNYGSLHCGDHAADQKADINCNASKEKGRAFRARPCPSK
jgi:hypothetical protein